MKFLESPDLEAINTVFSRIELADRCVEGRLEAYSCKQVGQDKRLAKLLDDRIIEEINRSPKSPDTQAISCSPFGPLTNVSSRKALIYLISLLNCSFPDYDFSSAKPEEFQREELLHVQTTINSFLGGSFPRDEQAPFLSRLWKALDDAISVRDSHIYSYIPNSEDDPLVVPGAFWSFNFFFYNKALKRIIFFTCKSTSKHRVGMYGYQRRGEEDDEDEEDME
eukprot:TRINITY_DN5641_c0_g2_i1.p1 TRINITY_DN5641_c0_g2~~TRINITY_DN5641_c0_g2_i1.p1  ORF type:complete len:223 (+),score=52.69 TRINITY_DN5641_c0_g2_i1:356-1024(+)